MLQLYLFLKYSSTQNKKIKLKTNNINKSSIILIICVIVLSFIIIVFKTQIKSARETARRVQKQSKLNQLNKETNENIKQQQAKSKKTVPIMQKSITSQFNKETNENIKQKQVKSEKTVPIMQKQSITSQSNINQKEINQKQNSQIIKQKTLDYEQQQDKKTQTEQLKKEKEKLEQENSSYISDAMNILYEQHKARTELVNIILLLIDCNDFCKRLYDYLNSSVCEQHHNELCLDYDCNQKYICPINQRQKLLENLKALKTGNRQLLKSMSMYKNDKELQRLINQCMQLQQIIHKQQPTTRKNITCTTPGITGLINQCNKLKKSIKDQQTLQLTICPDKTSKNSYTKYNNQDSQTLINQDQKLKTHAQTIQKCEQLDQSKNLRNYNKMHKTNAQKQLDKNLELFDGVLKYFDELLI